MRASATQYGETVWSDLLPGSRPSASCLWPAVEAVEIAFDLAPGSPGPLESFDLAAARRQQILWRLDGSFGTDPNLRWYTQVRPRARRRRKTSRNGI